MINYIFTYCERAIDPFRNGDVHRPLSGPLAFIAKYARLAKLPLIIVMTLSVASSFLSLYIIHVLGYVVDILYNDGIDNFSTEMIGVVLIICFVLFFIDPFFAFLQNTIMSQTLSVGLASLLQWQSHQAVETQDIMFFEDTFAGQVASRISQLTEAVQRQLIIFVESVPRFCIQFGGSLILVANASIYLALPVSVWIVGNIVVAWRAVPLYSKMSVEVAQTQTRAIGVMTDVYSNIQLVKLFSAESAESNWVKNAISTSVMAEHKLRRTFLLTNALVYQLNAALAVSMLIIGIFAIQSRIITIGEFVAAITVTRLLCGSSQAFIGLGQNIAQSFGIIKDSMAILTHVPVVSDVPFSDQLVLTKGKIVFENVSFSYDGINKIIDNFSLTIEPGEKIGIVGYSGAGKSTILNLLIRMFDPTEGRILIDDQDIRLVKQASLRYNIAFFSQDVHLLNRSLRDNMLYGKWDASDEDLKLAATIADAKFIENVKDPQNRIGYDAFTGAKGIRLSGGQRQRIAMARVFLKNSPILVMDEPTSALDSESEAVIQEGLSSLMRDKTVICVAHRLSTLSEMDRVVVVENGKIAEMGRPSELKSAGGLFARLWDLQTRAAS